MKEDIYISNISHYVPEKLITNEEIIKNYSLKVKEDFIDATIGIKTRSWAMEDQAASDLAVLAIKKLNLSPDFNGPIFLSTVSPDYFSPSTSVIVKGKLGLTSDAASFDINASCAGFIFAMDLAYRYLNSSESTEALVIASEVRSKFLNKEDRKTVFIFSDGASVLHLKKGNRPKSKINWITTKTVADLNYDILVPEGGSVTPYMNSSNFYPFIKMNDGNSIVEQIIKNLVELILSELALRSCAISHFDFFIFHQGNTRISELLFSKLGIDAQKTHSTFQKYGNSSSASMGISLSEASEKKLIKTGDKILLMAIGSGSHFGMSSVSWGIGN